MFCSNRFIPESIPWLVAKKKYGEAKKVTKWAAKINGISFPKHLFDEMEEAGDKTTDKEMESTAVLMEKETENKYTFLDLFRTPVIRSYTLITFYLW